MDDILDDNNVGLQVKAWLDKHGKTIAATVGLAIAMTVGIQFYQQRQIDNEVAASMLYDEYQQALITENEDALVASATVLREDYPNSVYATSVALLEAMHASMDERYEDAQEQLTWVQEAGQPFAKPLAALRLARIKVSQQDLTGALAVLDSVSFGEKSPNEAYRAGFEELRGDIAVMQGDRAKAGAHYKTALSAYEAQQFNNVLLQMKMETFK